MNDATPRLDSHAVWSEGSLYPKLEMYPMSGIMWSQARAYAPFRLEALTPLVPPICPSIDTPGALERAKTRVN